MIVWQLGRNKDPICVGYNLMCGQVGRYAPLAEPNSEVVGGLTPAPPIVWTNQTSRLIWRRLCDSAVRTSAHPKTLIEGPAPEKYTFNNRLHQDKKYLCLQVWVVGGAGNKDAASYLDTTICRVWIVSGAGSSRHPRSNSLSQFTAWPTAHALRRK